jgi:hypothetical protein
MGDRSPDGLRVLGRAFGLDSVPPQPAVVAGRKHGLRGHHGPAAFKDQQTLETYNKNFAQLQKLADEEKAIQQEMLQARKK